MKCLEVRYDKTVVMILDIDEEDRQFIEEALEVIIEYGFGRE